MYGLLGVVNAGTTRQCCQDSECDLTGSCASYTYGRTKSNDRVPVAEDFHVHERLVGRLSAFPTATVADALDAHGLAGVADGFRHVGPSPRFAGVARTAVVTDSAEPGLPGLAELIEHADPGDVLVFAWAAGAIASCFGGLAARRVRAKGCAGVLIDGGMRDLAEVADTLPAWFRYATPRSGRGRLRVRPVDHPVTVGAVTVAPADLVLADETGVCVVPAGAAERVLATAADYAERDAEAEARIDAGEPFSAPTEDAAQ
jgi:4-hydroxy-4-methyl-2-oxoglutarate aldolase